MSGSGWITWPEGNPQWKDTGEGGMWVYVFVLAQDDGDPGSDPFVRCHGPAETVCLPMPDFVTSDETEARVYPPGHQARVQDLPPGDDRVMGVFDAGYSVLAAVCLGSSDIAYGGDGGYWQCRDTDLTHEGMITVASLRQLYHRDPVLVTYLDT